MIGLNCRCKYIYKLLLYFFIAGVVLTACVAVVLFRSLQGLLPKPTIDITDKWGACKS